MTINSKKRLIEILQEGLKQFPTAPFTVETWSRDCDMCESFRTRNYPTKFGMLRSLVEWWQGLEWAEGPSGWSLAEPAPESTRTHDRVLAAFENGRGTSIYV